MTSCIEVIMGIGLDGLEGVLNIKMNATGAF
jgi:hypothetical protein